MVSVNDRIINEIAEGLGINGELVRYYGAERREGVDMLTVSLNDRYNVYLYRGLKEEDIVSQALYQIIYLIAKHNINPEGGGIVEVDSGNIYCKADGRVLYSREDGEFKVRIPLIEAASSHPMSAPKINMERGVIIVPKGNGLSTICRIEDNLPEYGADFNFRYVNINDKSRTKNSINYKASMVSLKTDIKKIEHSAWMNSFDQLPFICKMPNNEEIWSLIHSSRAPVYEGAYLISLENGQTLYRDGDKWLTLNPYINRELLPEGPRNELTMLEIVRNLDA